MSKTIIVGFLTAMIFANNAFASSQAITASVPITKNVTNREARKEVFLMPVQLTEKQIHSLNRYKNAHVEKQLTQRIALPSSYQVGMNNVPVFDQGRHGSCVTFAITAAIDAIMRRGEYVSQLCSLELGNYLEQEGYFPSGWDGSLGTIVLNQIQQFGIVSKTNQFNGLCAGVKEYPVKEEKNTGKPISLEEYKRISENLNTDRTFFTWNPMLTFIQRFEWDPENLDAEKTLIKVKQFLIQKDRTINMRLTFGTMIPVKYCSAGACAQFHAKDDTWALTEAMKKDDNLSLGGHELIITGYDDNAIAIDHDGYKHQGLLTLRNSWGNDVGDNGNYYMTYDFFKIFVMEIQELYFIRDLDQSNK